MEGIGLGGEAAPKLGDGEKGVWSGSRGPIGEEDLRAGAPRRRQPRAAGGEALGSKGKESSLHMPFPPTPLVHLLKPGGKCLTQSTARLQTFVQNILIKILSDIGTHTNDRTLLS